jgi:uncharacterized membrane-anchored protein
MIMKNKGLCLSIIVGLQVAWIVGTAISKEMILTRNTTVLLETLPVDPRDWLRGDFVILNYKISSVPVAWVQAPNTQENLNNRMVYVTLEQRGKFYEAVAASLDPVEAGPGKYVIRGTLEDMSRDRFDRMLRVRYGIERYYVPEGTGNPEGAVTVKCVVTADGSLLIKEVYINDRPYGVSMRETSR